MRVVFMGTPDFSVAALRAVAQEGHEIVVVYSQPPRKSGRGQKQRPSPVHAYADSQGLTVLTPKNFRDPVELSKFLALEACLLYTSPSPRDRTRSRMPSSA